GQTPSTSPLDRRGGHPDDDRFARDRGHAWPASGRSRLPRFRAVPWNSHRRSPAVARNRGRQPPAGHQGRQVMAPQILLIASILSVTWGIYLLGTIKL